MSSPSRPGTCARHVVIGVLLTTAIAGCSEPTAPGDGRDQLIFTSSREGVMRGSTPLMNIFRMNADGSGVENLTRQPGSYEYLALAPDGRTIIFEAARDFDPWTGSDCPSQIWAMGVDGTGLRKVTTGACSYMPRLSPDGRHVAFLRGNDVWAVGIDGAGARHVSHALPVVLPNACGEVPKVLVRTLGWVSANRLLFERHICLQGTTFYTVDTNGNGLAEVAYDGATAYLSPDGSKIAYNDAPFSLTPSLVVMNADGSGARTIATSARLPSRHSLSGTVWSPDGSRLYYDSPPEGQYVTGVDGTGTRRIADTWPAFRAGFHSWSSDGARMAFNVYTDSRTDVAVVNADGTGLVNLTAGSSGSSRGAIWIR